MLGLKIFKGIATKAVKTVSRRFTRPNPNIDSNGNFCKPHRTSTEYKKWVIHSNLKCFYLSYLNLLREEAQYERQRREILAQEKEAASYLQLTGSKAEYEACKRRVLALEKNIRGGIFRGSFFNYEEYYADFLPTFDLNKNNIK